MTRKASTTARAAKAKAGARRDILRWIIAERRRRRQAKAAPDGVETLDV